MSLLNVSDIQTALLVRNNRTTTDAFITDAMLDDWTRDAHVWAASYKKWVLTEGKASTTYASSVDGTDYFEGWKSDSIRFLQIGGKRLEKKNFYDFQKFTEDYPSDTKRIYSDYGRRIYVNVNADVSGTMTAWGQYTPVLDATDKTATTIFSSSEPEGNEAIVHKMTSYLKYREHSEAEALSHEQMAMAKLEEVWNKVKEEQFGYQTVEGDGMFKRIDVVRGNYRDDVIKRDQFT